MKTKTIIIIAAIVLIGVAVWYFMIYKSPDQKKAWIIDYVNSGGDNETGKQHAVEQINKMNPDEISVVYKVLYGLKGGTSIDTASDTGKQFDVIGKKYGIFG